MNLVLKNLGDVMYTILEKKKSLNFTYFKALKEGKFYFVKALNKDDKDLKEMMQQEVHMNKTLVNCSFIPKIIEYDLKENYTIVYEYIDGLDLSNCSFSYEEKIRVFYDLVLKIEQIHKHGIVHCDLKMSNLIIDSEKCIYVVDFANARHVGDEVIFGTKRYCSLEQLDKKPVSFSFDLYALGVICYELLSGKKAFEGLSGEDLYIAKKRNPLLLFEVPSLVNEIVERATTCYPEKKYLKIEDMKKDLEKLLEQV